MSGFSPAPAEDLASLGEHLFWPVERWRALQHDRLIAHLRHARSSPFYRNLPVTEGASQGEMDALFLQLPATTKNQLAAAGPEAWAVPGERVAEWVCTSGTAGRPLDVPLTCGDLQRLAENEAVALGVAGVRQGDLFVLAVGMERLFVAGLAYWLGAQRLGATCVRVGPQVAAHAEMVKEILARRMPREDRRAFVIAVPSFLTSVTLPERPLAGIIGIGEPLRTEGLARNALGQRLHERFGCPVMSTYAATETCVSFAEGPLCEGGHLNPALGMVEIMDDAGRVLPDGEVGEVVVTPLGVEGMPLVRFRTGDMAALFSGVCACGRTTPRLGPILGRRQQLLKVRGTSVFPSAIVEALRSAPGVVDCVVIAETQELLSDSVTVHVHAQDATAAGRERIEGRLRAVLRVTPTVHFTDAATLQAMQFSTGGRKAVRFLDRRSAGPVV